MSEFLLSEMSSINLKPNKLESFSRKKEYATVNTWFYNIEQYLSLTQPIAPKDIIEDHSKISLAGT